MKTLFKTVMVSLVLNLVAACGNDFSETPSEVKDADKKEESKSPLAGDGSPQSVTLKGYVASAFDLEVDGRSYIDSEDFYTQQLDVLQDKAVEAGYADYQVKFEAKVGFDDLKNDMRVYISSMDSRGYAGDTRVNGSGQFQMHIPAEGASQAYRVRANKRVSVLLTGPNKEKVRWCYNFSAVEGEIDVSNPLPIILSHFQTTITKYECQQESSSNGLNIPVRQGSQPAPAEDEPENGADVVIAILKQRQAQ